MSTVAVKPKTIPGNIPDAAIADDLRGRLSDSAAKLLTVPISAAITNYREPSSVGSNHLAAFPLGEKFGVFTMQNLSWLKNHPESDLMQKVKMACSRGCGATFEGIKAFAGSTACDECRAAWDKAELTKALTKKWEKICPKQFRETDEKHPQFARAQLAALTRPVRWTGTESLFLYGPTGTCKTRVGVLMIERALQHGLDVGILWPEKLRSLVQGFGNSDFDSYAGIGVLLMDDPLLTACRESKLMDAVKMLVDVRMREGRATIITSQIGTEAELTEAKEYGDAKGADKERIQALLRRVREKFKVVSFAPVPVEAGQVAF